MTFRLIQKLVLVSGSALGLGLAHANPAGAASLYSENFSGQDGQGASDTSGVSWSVNLGDAVLVNGNDFFEVRNGAFSAQDTNAGCDATSNCNNNGDYPGTFPPALPTWLSPVFSVAGFNNLQLSLDAAGSGDFEVGNGFNSEDDYLISYILDGGSAIQVGDLITANGAFPDQTFTSAIPSGNNLQILVAMNTYAGSERLTLDNVAVTGDLGTTAVPTPALLPGLVGFGMSLLRKRRKQFAEMA